MRLFKTPEELRQWRSAKTSLALVPTMGALHEGHLSLVQESRKYAKHSVVTIFVNPLQFAPNEDLNKYPRTFEEDVKKLASIGVDALFAPHADIMVPTQFSTPIIPEGAAKVGLEDTFRPTHFQGVATIVMKLLNLADCDYAIFGEKDYQQLAVIKQMVRDLNHKTQILSAPTFREKDGLAMSSRNRYLSPQEREIAPLIYQTLTSHLSLSSMKESLTKASFVIDYLEKRDAESLQAAQKHRPQRLLFAGKLGATRLIDNIAL